VAKKSIFQQETLMKYSAVENSSFMCISPLSYLRTQRSAVRETEMGGMSTTSFIVIY